MDYHGLVTTIEELLANRQVSKVLSTVAIIEKVGRYEDKTLLYQKLETTLDERNLGKIEFALDMVDQKPPFEDSIDPMELMVKASGLDIPDWQDMPPEQLMMKLYENREIREMMEFTSEVFQMVGVSPFERYK